MPEDNNIINIQEALNFKIEPCNNTNFDTKNYKKLNMTQSQKSSISMFSSQIPALASAGTLANAYVVKMPEGLPEGAKLMEYTAGGKGTPIVDANNRIIAHASMHQIQMQAVCLGAFSAMSIATGQYFLTNINESLTMLNQKFDKVLSFLYGDKKAELISEINFVQYAYNNFLSLMEHDNQRTATISNLQSARKIAMKDIEFYISDLDTKADSASKTFDDFLHLSDEAFQIKDSLELSIQLYVMSTVMESYYAQNTDADYLKALKSDMRYYIDKCSSRILSDFSKLNGRHMGFKPSLMKKVDESQINSLNKKFEDVIQSLSTGEESKMHKTIDSALKSPASVKEFYINNKNEVYIDA